MLSSSSSSSSHLVSDKGDTVNLPFQFLSLSSVLSTLEYGGKEDKLSNSPIRSIKRKEECQMCPQVGYVS